MSGDTEIGGGGRAFPLTTWGLVTQIGGGPRERRAGLERLCRRYWKPIYCYVRQFWRKSDADAKDLTQAFFMWLVEGEVLAKYEPELSSFRVYLKALLKNFVRNQERAGGRIKRGGQADHLPLDDDTFANLPELLPDRREESPEDAFDRTWFEELIQNATNQVLQELRASNQHPRVQVFEAYELAPPGEQLTYEAVGERLGLPKGTVRNHLFAVRERIRAQIRTDLRETVTGAEQLESEWRLLFG